MHQDTFQFRVFVPLRGILMLVFIGLITILGLYLLDSTGIALLRNHLVRLLLLIVPAGFAYYYFGKLATVMMEVKLNATGIWIQDRPVFFGNRAEDHFIGWNDIERWIFKAADTSGHGISWDRFRLKLSGGQIIRLYPVEDFEENRAFLPFLSALRYYTGEYNARHPGAAAIEETETAGTLKWLGLVKIVFWLCFTAMILLAGWLEFQKGQPRWFLMAGYVFLLSGAVILIRKSLTVIRQNV